VASGDLLARDELLSGRLHVDRRSTRLFTLIEARIAYLRAESRRAIEAFFLHDQPEFRRRFDSGYLQAIKVSAQSDYRLTPADLERFAPQWRALLPRDLQQRASLLHLLDQRFHLDPARLPRTFEALGAADPDLTAAYESAYGRPPTAGSAAAFGDLPPGPADFSAEVEVSLEWLELPSGAVLFRSGDPGDSLYVVVSGRLRTVRTGPDGNEEVVAELGRGELIGVEEVLTEEPRALTVYPVRDSALVRLPRTALERLVGSHPEVLWRLNRVLARRLRLEVGGARPAANTVRTFAVVAAGPSAPLAEFARRLADELAGSGPALHLDRAQLESRLGPGTADLAPDSDEGPRITSWLDEQETQHRFVVYEAEAEPTEWTLRCLRQADRVLVLADARADPTPGAVEARLATLARPAPVDLVLVHPPETRRPSGTGAWLDARNLHDHHHIRLEDDALLARLARRLTGRAIGLVLSGGGARGFAHVGAIRALAEAGVPIDLVGGTSMGAAIGAGLALDWGDAEFQGLAATLSDRKRVRDLTLPFVSFYATRKLTQIIQTWTEGAAIEDLWRPFFCVSSNLSRAEIVVHRRGELWRAVRASTAIPGVFAPMPGSEGEVLVDGGTMNNFPLDIMRDRFEAGTVIGVLVSPARDRLRPYRFGASVSGWHMLRGRLRLARDVVDAPSVMANLMRTVEINTLYQLKAGGLLESADLLIRPALEQFGILEFERFPEIIEIGCETARPAVAAWLEARQKT
jgi:predicted acylesterase/phospholipase RssA